MDVSSAIHARRAVPSFDSSVEISLEELVALMNEANLAPSAMNLQPWEFLVCHTIEDKKRLQAVSYQQAKVAEASAVVVVLGNLQHHHHATRIADENVKTGVLPEDRRDAWVAGAVGAYEGLSKKQRDRVDVAAFKEAAEALASAGYGELERGPRGSVSYRSTKPLP